MKRYNYFPREIDKLKAAKVPDAKPAHVIKARKIDEVSRLPRAYRTAGGTASLTSNKAVEAPPKSSKPLIQQVTKNIPSKSKKYKK